MLVFGFLLLLFRLLLQSLTVYIILYTTGEYYINKNSDDNLLKIKLQYYYDDCVILKTTITTKPSRYAELKE